jgi:uncharacterized protein (TIGR03083 family)
MTMPTDETQWLTALRHSHEHLAQLATGLGSDGSTRSSYCSDWTISQVFSHLGSQAEIFELFVTAGLTGGDAPGVGDFGPIWEAWNARTPDSQVTDSLAADDALLRRVEALEADELASFKLAAFGRELDAVGVLRMRLAEHAVHTWDVAVALDPEATVQADAAALLVDGLGDVVGRAGKPTEEPDRIEVLTSEPERRFVLVADGVRLEPASDEPTAGTLRLPAEALVRLVYGRLDAEHAGGVELEGESLGIDDVRAIFPGF